MKHTLATTLLVAGLAIALPAVAAEDNLNFKNYGNWGSPQFAAQFDSTAYLSHLTDPTKMPIKGSAIYTGSVVGGVTHSFSTAGCCNYFSYQTALAGAVNVDVNFAARTANTTFSNLAEKSIGSIGPGTTLNVNGVATPTISVPGSITLNSVTGTTQAYTPVSGNYEAVNGKFYGPNAAAVAGTLSKSTYTFAAPSVYSNQGTYVNGTFGASKH